ncbi:prepilin-type N-terminal cleavage/methylation domain-containing protein [Luteibacter sp. CQ10]|uniref:type IV pilus modification PilV family protein n=1 Tax=Luteibacter sp. CQ10 TaxID=2805821 RepID=UPI0034A42D68
MPRVHGSSLIECLVALAIFAIGSAAHATWLAHSLGVHARASRSFAATTVASNLATRMRANLDGVRRGDYTKPANHRDMTRFRRDLAEHLGPGASGKVDCEPDLSCRIRIDWAGHEEITWYVPSPPSAA